MALIRNSNLIELPFPFGLKSLYDAALFIRDGPDHPDCARRFFLIQSYQMALIGDSTYRSVSESLNSIGRVGKCACDAFCKCLSWVVCCSTRARGRAPALVPLPVHAVTSC